MEDECENILQSLKESLRHNYGHTRSQEFYEECKFRLSITRQQLASATDQDVDELELYSRDLSRLSSLITRIERSHLGEFSWPFADALGQIGRAICRGLRGNDRSYDAPIFAISADGGLEAYSIEPGQDPIPHTAKRRIFNIVFPRTLKHHVLLHSILAHELGHAAAAVPSMQAALEKQVLQPLVQGSPLSDEAALSKWLQEWGNETSIRFTSGKMEGHLRYWREEFLCDLIGLLLFGPAFVGAHRALLGAIDPRGLSPGDEHSPNVTRFDVLDKAVDILGWNKVDTSLPKRIRRDIQLYWDDLRKVCPKGPKTLTTFFDRNKINSAVEALVKILDPLGPALYRPASSATFSRLVDLLYSSIPPVGAEIDARGETKLQAVDFRSVLYAGWVTWSGWSRERPTDRPSFLVVNKLCDRAILQQQAIEIWRAPRKGEKQDGGSVKEGANSTPVAT